MLASQKFLITPEAGFDEGDDEYELGFKPEALEAEELRKKERQKQIEELRQKVGLISPEVAFDK